MEKKHMGTTSKSRAALAAFVLAFALTLAPLTAHAQQATNGGNGGSAGGISSGKNGANGSDGVLLSGVSSVAGGTFTAGNGGSGGSGGNSVLGGSYLSGGGGGNGGNAAVAQAGSTVTVTGGTFTAGSGGNGGGSVAAISGSGGGGGSGGSALVALSGSTVTVTGGTFSLGHNGSSAANNGGSGGQAGYDLFANGGAITVYGSGFSPGSVGPSLTGSGTLTATIGGVTQTLSYSVSTAAGSAIFLKNSGTLATTTGLTVSPNPSVAGQLVTLTAAVTSSGGMPTGSVTFQLGNATLGTVLLTNGTATFTTHALPIGSDALTAYYTGDGSFAPSSGGFVQPVMPTSADVVAEFLGGPETIGGTNNSGYFGQSFTTATILPATNIAFRFEAAPYSTASPYAMGTAYLLSLPYTGLPSGLSSQTPGFLGVTTASGGVYNFGASVTLQPHTQYFLYENALFPNDAIYGGGQYAGGNFYYALPSPLPLRLGNNPFVPDPGSNSACFLVTGVSLSPPYATATGLTSSVNPSVVGQPVTFTAAVTSNGGKTTGTVQFAVDGANAGGPVTLGSSGQATDTETFLTPGTHTVTVTYTPTGLFLGNAGATFTQTVNPHVSPQYVSPSGSDSGDGSQASPKRTLQAAVNATQSGDTVLVEDGTYTGDGNRDIDFGGRNITVQSASGDPTQTVIDCGGSASSPHRGFYFHSGETNAVVSGLTIRNGYQIGSAVDIVIGSAVTLTNCILTGNVESSNPIGFNRGGGVSNFGTVTLTNCTLTGNSATEGGGVYNAGTATLTNCTLTSNRATAQGGGLFNNGALTLTNCTLTGNSAASGGGVYNSVTVTLTNDILYGDTGGEIFGTVTATHCDVQGGYAGTGDINADPRFVNAPTDLHLKPGSPCLGAGTGAGAPATDLDGTLRPSPPSIGAYDRAAVSHTHLLWNNADSRVMLWNLDSTGNVLGVTGYGPYTDTYVSNSPSNLWHATALAAAPDGTSRLLWNNTDHRVMLWSLDGQGNVQSITGYGPYTDNYVNNSPTNLWSAVGVSVGPDSITHLLWSNADHRMMFWDVDKGGNVLGLTGYGPYTDTSVSLDPGNLWSATALATGLDNVSRVVWNNADHRVMLWSLNGQGGASVQSVTGYGPYTDTYVSNDPGNLWSAQGVSVGPNNVTHLLWGNVDHRMMFWDLDARGNVLGLTGYGPYTDTSVNTNPGNLWDATAVATGPDGVSHVGWDNADHRVMVWGLGGANVLGINGFGPYTDDYVSNDPANLWSMTAVSAGP